MTNWNRSLETERLLLRKLVLDDTAAVFAYACDDEVSKYTFWGSHRDHEDTAVFLNMVLDKYNYEEPSDWGIILKETGTLIGTVGWVNVSEVHRSAELGYVLSRAYWGQGIITEAVKRIIDFGFHQLQLNRIEAKCIVENLGSERVMQKAGMSFEGTSRESLIIKGSLASLNRYAILKSDLVK